MVAPSSSSGQIPTATASALQKRFTAPHITPTGLSKRNDSTYRFTRNAASAVLLKKTGGEEVETKKPAAVHAFMVHRPALSKVDTAKPSHMQRPTPGRAEGTLSNVTLVWHVTEASTSAGQVVSHGGGGGGKKAAALLLMVGAAALAMDTAVICVMPASCILAANAAALVVLSVEIDELITAADAADDVATVNEMATPTVVRRPPVSDATSVTSVTVTSLALMPNE
jgi:hypothetical protein